METQNQVAETNMDVLISNSVKFKRKLKFDQIMRGVNYNVDDLQMLLLMHEMLLHMIVWLLDDQTSLDTEVHGHEMRFERNDDFPF